MKSRKASPSPEALSTLLRARGQSRPSLLTRAEKAEQERDQALLRITQLEAAQRPRPMDEAPKGVEIYALVRVRVSARGTDVIESDYQGWLPLPDQDTTP